MSHQPPTALPRELLGDEDMQRALCAHDFGTVFRMAREHAGMSYSKLGAALDIKPERISALARGTGRITTFDKIRQISEALRVPGHMLGLAPQTWEAEGAPAGTSPWRGAPTRRRTVLRVATTAGPAAALPALHHAPEPARITASYVERLRERTARALELATGVASARPMQRVAPLVNALRPHTELPVVGELLEQAGA
ncbi:helix-turn-helix domain-containing protein [Streptomyces sp. NPDC098101]|uniref:helix-turn-helix domain-containing protein n=1 Tax=Streptomyces sp. NPDC098101 TaxID=3366096 RepID=UPI0037F4677E